MEGSYKTFVEYCAIKYLVSEYFDLKENKRYEDFINELAKILKI